MHVPSPGDFVFSVKAASGGAAWQTLTAFPVVCSALFHLPGLPLLNYFCTFHVLLHFSTTVPWDYLKRGDGHQLQNKCCLTLLLGRKERFPPFRSPPLLPTEPSAKHNYMQHLTTELINYVLLEVKM